MLHGQLPASGHMQRRTTLLCRYNPDESLPPRPPRRSALSCRPAKSSSTPARMASLTRDFIEIFWPQPPLRTAPASARRPDIYPGSAAPPVRTLLKTRRVQQPPPASVKVGTMAVFYPKCPPQPPRRSALSCRPAESSSTPARMALLYFDRRRSSKAANPSVASTCCTVGWGGEREF